MSGVGFGSRPPFTHEYAELLEQHTLLGQEYPQILQIKEIRSYGLQPVGLAGVLRTL